jgi:hypothetical protein
MKEDELSKEASLLAEDSFSFYEFFNGHEVEVREFHY